MKLISHRGNVEGPDEDLENSPAYIRTALGSGFDVEIDVWLVDGKLHLGHDAPSYGIDDSFLTEHGRGLWCHAKNVAALRYFVSKQDDVNMPVFFWHQKDDFTLTSRAHIWTYPGFALTDKSICVLPEIANNSIEEISECYGICSDNIKHYKSLLERL